MTLRVDAFELGTFRFPELELRDRRGVVMGFAVHHDGGVLLIDTGFGFGHPELVNCHLHADHAGQNDVFPGIPTWVQPAEWSLAHTPDHTIVEWVDYPGADIRPVPGDHQVLPGVRIIATPGHTAGHQSVAIDTADGLTLLVGQACYTSGEWQGDPDALEGRSTAPNPGAYDRSIERLRALRPAIVRFGHDREPWVAGAGS